MKTFFMTIGISGSGKSTFLKSFRPDEIVCPDQIRIELCGDISDQSKNGEVLGVTRKRVNEKLNSMDVAVLDATNTTTRNRKGFLKNIDKGVATIAVVFPLVDPQEAFSRIQKDIQEGVVRSNVPLGVIERQAEGYKNSFDNIPNEFDIVFYLKEDNELKNIVINPNGKFNSQSALDAFLKELDII